MIKMIVSDKKTDELSIEQYRDHCENVHVPLVRSFFPTVGRYRRNNVDRDRTALTERNAEAAWAQTDFDSVTEVLFADWAAFATFRDTSAQPAVRERIMADEATFLEVSAIRRDIVVPDGDAAWQ